MIRTAFFYDRFQSQDFAALMTVETRWAIAGPGARAGGTVWLEGLDSRMQYGRTHNTPPGFITGPHAVTKASRPITLYLTPRERTTCKPNSPQSELLSMQRFAVI